MCDVKGDTYEEKLKDAEQKLLWERRLCGDMIEVFNVVRGINKVEKEKWFKMMDNKQRVMRQNAVVGEGGQVERSEYVILYDDDDDQRGRTLVLGASAIFVKKKKSVKHQ